MVPSTTLPHLYEALESPAVEHSSAGGSIEGAGDRWPNLDPTVIESLRELGDETFSLADLRATFADTARETIDEIQEAVDNDDATLVRALAHRLKGSGASIGAQRFALMCRELESHAGGELDGRAAAQTLDELRAEFDEVIVALAEALPDFNPGGQG